MSNTDEILDPIRFLTTNAGRALTYESGEPVMSTVGDSHFAAATPSETRWVEKATAYAKAWQDVFPGDVTSTWAVALALAVAQHETWCGDAWAGEHNWGGVQLGGLNQAEQACLGTAGITPTPQNLATARQALFTAGLTRQGGALHIDSSPTPQGKRYYFAWFAEFPDDEQGAAYFIKVIAKNRPSCAAVLKQALGAWRADSLALAAAMYATHYYEGFHDPNQPGGKQANIQDYGSAIFALAPPIFANLQSQGFNTSPGVPVFDLSNVTGYQSALTFLAGKVNNHTYDPMGIDGIEGPHTRSAIRAFQQNYDLPPTGEINDATTQALQQAIDQAVRLPNP